MRAAGSRKVMLQGLIQAAAGLHKVRESVAAGGTGALPSGALPSGALWLFSRAAQKLDSAPMPWRDRLSPLTKILREPGRLARKRALAPLQRLLRPPRVRG